MNMNLETLDVEKVEVKLSMIDKMRKELDILTNAIKAGYKTPKPPKKAPENEKRTIVLEEVKKWENGVPLPEYYKIIKKAGYLNSRAGGIYFRKGRGLFVLGKLPNGEKRVFFNPAVSTADQEPQREEAANV